MQVNFFANKLVFNKLQKFINFEAGLKNLLYNNNILIFNNKIYNNIVLITSLYIKSNRNSNEKCENIKDFVM